MPQAKTEPLNALVEKIRAKYPGAYDDMDDAELTKRVLAKYPQYSDLAAPPMKAPVMPPMQPSYLATALGSDNTERSAIANPQQPAEQFALENPEQQGKLATASAIGAAGSVPGVAAGVARKAGPYVLPALGSLAINKARDLPVVGPVVRQIPFAEMLPWIFAGHGEKQPPEEPPVYPGAPEPTALPEQLNPALTSESRTLPGQVGKEVIGRVARPEAIPPRSGLMLPSAKEPISTVQHPNFPTPESRAASDASFARRHPNADFQSGMSPDAERAWQESAGFKSEPAIDIGAKVRAANPEPTRAESRTGPIGHSEWPPPEPEGPYSQVPKRPRGIIDVQDDAAVKQEVQNRIASSDQKWMAQASAERAARNSPAVRKGVLTGQVDELGIPISPVGKPTGPRGLSPAAPEATDLTPEWTKALEDLKAKKGQKGNLGD